MHMTQHIYDNKCRVGPTKSVTSSQHKIVTIYKVQSKYIRAREGGWVLKIGMAAPGPVSRDDSAPNLSRYLSPLGDTIYLLRCLYHISSLTLAPMLSPLSPTLSET